VHKAAHGSSGHAVACVVGVGVHRLRSYYVTDLPVRYGRWLGEMLRSPPAQARGDMSRALPRSPRMSLAQRNTIMRAGDEDAQMLEESTCP